MKKFKLIGVTRYAKNCLSEEDILSLITMIGSEVQESNFKSKVDDRMLLEMPDGERTHIDFLELEEIQPELNFENQNHV